MGQGLIFVGLNLFDTALTLKLAPMGSEFNWYRLVVDMPILFVSLKFLLVAVVLYCIYRFGYMKLVKPLNIGMLGVVGVNLACLSAYLAGYF